MFLEPGGPVFSFGVLTSESQRSWISGQVADFKAALRSDDGALLQTFVDNVNNRILARQGPLQGPLQELSGSSDSDMERLLSEKVKCKTESTFLLSDPENQLDAYKKACWQKMAKELVAWLACHMNPVTRCDSALRKSLKGREIIPDSLLNLYSQWRHFTLSGGQLESTLPYQTIFSSAHTGEDKSPLAYFSRAFVTELTQLFDEKKNQFNQATLALPLLYICRAKAECLHEQLVCCNSDSDSDLLPGLLADDEYKSYSVYPDFYLYLLKALSVHQDSSPINSACSVASSTEDGKQKIRNNLSQLFSRHAEKKEIFKTCVSGASESAKYWMSASSLSS